MAGQGVKMMHGYSATTIFFPTSDFDKARLVCRFSGSHKVCVKVSTSAVISTAHVLERVLAIYFATRPFT